MPILALVFALLLAAGLSERSMAAEPAPESRGEAGRRVWLRYLEALDLAAEGLESGDGRLIDQAILALREMIRLDPAAAEPHLDLGNLYLFAKGDLQLAATEAREVIRLSPESVDGYLLLGRLACLALRQQEETEVSGDREQGSDLYSLVIASYRKVAELNPRQTEAWLILQSVYEAKRQFDDQVPALERFLAAPPIGPENFFVQRLIDPPFTEDQAWYKLSLLYLRRGSFDAALGAARRAYEADPDTEAYESNLWRLLELIPSREEEVRILRQLSGAAGRPRLTLRYAAALIRAGREDEAIALLRDPADLDVAARAMVVATAQRRLNRRERALETLTRGLAATRGVDRPGLQFEIALTLEEMGRDREAIERYEQLFARLQRAGSRPADSAGLLNRTVEHLAGLLRRTGNRVRLQSLLARTRRVVDEQNPLPDQIAVELLRVDGRYPEALTMARAAARRYRDDRSWLLTESSLLSEMRQFAESRQMIEASLIGTPEGATEDSGLYLHLAGILEQQGDLEQALATARRATELTAANLLPPDQLVRARLLTASILHRLGRQTESVRLLREILALEPAEPAALNNLGYFLVEQGRSADEAQRLIERAVAIDPLNGSFLDSLGWALFRRGEGVKARQMLERALLFSPRSATINEHLGEVLYSLGRTVEARQRWERALELSDDSSVRERLRQRLK